MAKLFSVLAALLSFASLVLVAISLATNHWVKLSPDTQPQSPLNPLTNDTFSNPTLLVQHNLDYFGLWVGCHREITFNKISCAYIGASCYSNVCWVRNDRDDKCLNFRLPQIDKCAAYQATRAMAIIGTIFLVLGSSILVVSMWVSSNSLSIAGTLFTFLAALFLMIAFAVFYDRNFKLLDDIASIGWSFILLIVAWPLAFVASLVGVPASLQSEKREEYSEME